MAPVWYDVGQNLACLPLRIDTPAPGLLCARDIGQPLTGVLDRGVYRQ